MLFSASRDSGSGSGAPDVPVLRAVHGSDAETVLGLMELSAADAAAAWWWVGVHGGAGESTLQELYVGTRASGHRWPVAAGRRPEVVLVARTHARGLLAVQAALRDLAYRQIGVSLLGVVLIADAPGRLPRPLRELADRVARSGVVPRAWSLPFVREWREGEVPSRANSPKQALWLLEELTEARDREAGL
jgi:hypothetical protein